MNTTTLPRRPFADPIGLSLTKAVTAVLTGLNALDKKLRERPSSLGEQTAELLRLADAYEATQPSYAADLRAAAMTATAALEAKSAR
jgi:hypothetical protein